MVTPEELRDASEVYHEPEAERLPPDTKNRRKERIRDVCKILKSGETLRILALENMELVDYAAPFRCIQYDIMEYSRQLDILRKKNKREKNLATPAERICGLRRTDRLMPAYTLCLYHGSEKWDGPRSLRDMMHFAADDDRFRESFSDYPMHLYCLNEADDLDKFQTEVGILFQALRFRKDRKGLKQLLQNNAKYRQVDADSLEAMTVLLDLPSIWKEREKYIISNEDHREGYNMCQAVREWAEEERKLGRAEGRELGRAEGKAEGRELGRTEGREEGKIFVVRNLIRRGAADEYIMEIVECDREYVARVRAAM